MPVLVLTISLDVPEPEDRSMRLKELMETNSATVYLRQPGRIASTLSHQGQVETMAHFNDRRRSVAEAARR